MKISISSNITEVLGWTARLHPQMRFAAAKTLTDLAKQVQRAMPAELARDLDRPSPFTTQGTFITPARKDALRAVVGFKDKQAAYLSWQVEGGTRQPARKALRLPTAAELNAYGNLPAGLIKQLIARAKAGKRATKGQARRFGVSKLVDLFYGDPGDGRPAGIYKRVAIGTTRHQLVPIVVFPRQGAKYRKRFDFYGKAERIVTANVERLLDANWRAALATAR